MNGIIWFYYVDIVGRMLGGGLLVLGLGLGF